MRKRLQFRGGRDGDDVKGKGEEWDGAIRANDRFEWPESTCEIARGGDGKSKR